MSQKPTGCVKPNPSNQSILLGGKWINQSAISRSQGIDISFLSKILSGKKPCNLSMYRRIATAVGMGLEELLDAIETRRVLLLSRDQKVKKQYESRIELEDAADRAKVRKGKIPAPRIPIYRLPADRK